MSQQEIQSAWDSFCQVFAVVLPLVIVSGIVSLCNYFQRHWGVEPFVLSKLLIGIGTDIVYGSLVGLAAIGAGRSCFLAWALAGGAVHCGIRRLECICRKLLCNKYGIERERDDESD